jgi:subtilase family serine protease
MSHSRRARRGIAAGGTLGVLFAMAAAAATSAPAAANTTSWVATSTVATAIKGASLTGDAAASTPLQLAVTLKPQNASAEQAALKAMYTPGSATYHKFLTPAQWEAAYAPTTAGERREDLPGQ